MNNFINDVVKGQIQCLEEHNAQKGAICERYKEPFETESNFI